MRSKRSKSWTRRWDAINSAAIEACGFRVGDWVEDDLRQCGVVTQVSADRGHVTVHYRVLRGPESRELGQNDPPARSGVRDAASPHDLMHTDPLP